MKALVLAVLAAIASQPLVTVAWFAIDGLFAGEPLAGLVFLELWPAVLIVASGFVILSGLPTFLLLRRYGRASRLSLMVAGFLLAAVPAAYLGFPGGCAHCSSGGSWHGRYVQFEIDGTATIYGWASYAESLVFFGAHGLVAALVFYLTWQRLAATPGTRRRAGTRGEPSAG